MVRRARHAEEGEPSQVEHDASWRGGFEDSVQRVLDDPDARAVKIAREPQVQGCVRLLHDQDQAARVWHGSVRLGRAALR